MRQANEHPYARTNNTVDNIRELAGSPQRGVYTWKDNSPGSGFTPSGATSTVAALAAAHQQQLQQQHQAMVSVACCSLDNEFFFPFFLFGKDRECNSVSVFVDIE